MKKGMSEGPQAAREEILQLIDEAGTLARQLELTWGEAQSIFQEVFAALRK